MLVLSRKVGQRVVIDDRIVLVVNRIDGNRVVLGIEAPADVHVLRGELKDQWEPAARRMGAPVGEGAGLLGASVPASCVTAASKS